MTSHHHATRGQSLRQLAHVVVVGGTLIVILAVVATLVVYRPLPDAVDTVNAGSLAQTNTVDQTTLISYCPSRMTLPDAEQFGDTGFRSSEGDIASSARYSALGSAYSSTVDDIQTDGNSTLELQGADTVDAADVKIASGNADHAATVMTTHLLAAESGTGVASGVASWATEGDLRGVAASTCASPELSQSFVLPETKTGTTQQLVVANPSAKPTAVEVKVWGTTQSGMMDLSTSSSVNVQAKGQTTVDLAAAAPDQRALFVTISSDDTPVASVVRVVKMQGLDPHGNDFIGSTPSSQRTGVLPGVRQGDHVSVALFAKVTTSVSFSWVTANGLTPATKHAVAADRVTALDLGAVPSDAIAISYDAPDALWTQAQITRDGASGQQDVAYVAPAAASASSAVAVPDHLDADVTLVNPTNESSTATLRAFNASGATLASKRIHVKAHSAMSMAANDVAPGAAVLLLKGSRLIWNARLSQSAVGKASVAGVGVMAPSALEPSSERIVAVPDQSLVP